jgi:hypothetical protein
MKKAIITAVAMLFAGAAYATDLPSKNSPKYFDLETGTPAPLNSIGFSVGPEATPGSYKKPSLWMYNFSYDRDIAENLSMGVNFGTTQDYPNGAMTQTIEGKIGYSLPLGNGFKARFGAGVGQRFIDGDNYGFYAFRTGMDYKLTDRLTWNAIGYQYRTTMDAIYRTDYENHDVRTGLSYALTDRQSINAAVYRSYNKDRTAHADGFLVGYSVKF